MPRFFFHLQSGNTHVEDHGGHELDSAFDAYFHARKLIREAQPYLTDDDGRWVIRIPTGEESELIVLFPMRKVQSKFAARWRTRKPAGSVDAVIP